jgi:orotidine-5'-phosphate decarboxylase
MATIARAPQPNYARQRIILALDVASAAEAHDWINRVSDDIGLVKIGLELFVSEGPSIVAEIRSHGLGVFLDLKFHDIPNTIAHAVHAAGRQGIRMIDVHASAGEAALKAAVDAAQEFGNRRPMLLGVTVLTSLDDAALSDMGIAGPTHHRVLEWAKKCEALGLDGVLASAHEARAIRHCCGEDFLIVTSGIRSAEDPRDDQKRVATAAEAVREGADYLVVGRAVLRAPDPLAALQSISEEIEAALAGSGEEGTELFEEPDDGLAYG